MLLCCNADLNSGFLILYHEGTAGRPGIEIVESLDLFLVAFVFLIVSLGFVRLFNPESRLFSSIALPWLEVKDFFQLKHLTWDAFLLTLMITFGTQAVRADGHFEWTMLVIPVAVILFSASSKLLKH